MMHSSATKRTPLPRILKLQPNFWFTPLEAFFATGSKAGIQPAHAARLKRQLARLDQASEPGDMNVPGWKLHALKGTLAGHWAVWVRGNWRLTFAFDGTDAVVVDCQDYH